MSKVLIIGCGGVASVAIHKCCQVPEVFTEICIASRTKAKCDKLAAELAPTTTTKITTAQVDADKVEEVIALLNARKNQIFCVRGNCDTEVDQMVLEFPVLADYAVLTAGSRLLYATHGHVYNTAHLPPLQPGDILLHGHTHIPAWEVFGTDNLYLNPGSVSIPKAGTPHSYMTLENGVFTWKELGGEAYHTESL